MKREEPRIKRMPVVRKETRKAERVQTGDIDSALKRIHAQYGNDLQAFFRDARESILKQTATVSDDSEAFLM